MVKYWSFWWCCRESQRITKVIRSQPLGIIEFCGNPTKTLDILYPGSKRWTNSSAMCLSRNNVPFNLYHQRPQTQTSLSTIFFGRAFKDSPYKNCGQRGLWYILSDILPGKTCSVVFWFVCIMLIILSGTNQIKHWAVDVSEAERWNPGFIKLKLPVWLYLNWPHNMTQIPKECTHVQQDDTQTTYWNQEIPANTLKQLHYMV